MQGPLASHSSNVFCKLGHVVSCALDLRLTSKFGTAYSRALTNRCQAVVGEHWLRKLCARIVLE